MYKKSFLFFASILGVFVFSFFFSASPVHAMPGSLTQTTELCAYTGAREPVGDAPQCWTFAPRSSITIPQDPSDSTRVFIYMHNTWVTTPAQFPWRGWSGGDYYDFYYPYASMTAAWGYACPPGFGCHSTPYVFSDLTPWTVLGRKYTYQNWGIAQNQDYQPGVELSNFKNIAPGTYRIYFYFSEFTLSPAHNDLYGGEVITAVPPNHGCQFTPCIGPISTYVDITVTPPTQQPDLVTQDLYINSANPAAGDAITFFGQVKNQGTGGAGAYFVKFCIDSSNCYSSEVNRVGTAVSMPALVAGGFSGVLNTNATWIATAGSHTVHVCADSGKVVSESNENNNCAPFTFTVASPTPGSCGTANGKAYPSATSAYTPDTQCATGVSSNTAFPAIGSNTSWICNGTGGGASSGTCSASRASSVATNILVNLSYTNVTKSGWNYVSGNSATVTQGDIVSIRQNTTFSSTVRSTGSTDTTSVIRWVVTSCPLSTPPKWAFSRQPCGQQLIPGFPNDLSTSWFNVGLNIPYIDSNAPFIFFDTSNTPPGTYSVNFLSEEVAGYPAPAMISANKTFTLTVVAPPVAGTCGTANGKAYPSATSAYAPDTQCATGVSSNTAFPAIGSNTSWICNGTGGGAPSGTCSASRLVATPNGLSVTPSTCSNNWLNISWNASAGANNYKVYRDGGATPVYDGDGVSDLNPDYAFSDTGLALGSSHSYTIKASNLQGSSALSSPAVQGTVAVACSVPVTTFTATPLSMTLPAANSTVLAWSATNSPTGCTAASSPINANWNGAKGISGPQTISGLTAGSYTFSLYCNNIGGPSAVVTRVVTVSPPAVATANITANGSHASTNIAYNGPVTIAWNYSSATSCALDPAVAVISIPPSSGSGSFSIDHLTETELYKIICQPGNISDEVTVNVPAQPKDLNVIKAGQGTVTSSPVGISCGAGCLNQTASFTPGETIILTAAAASGRTFTGWSGVVCTEGSQKSPKCTFAMNTTGITVTASFVTSSSYNEF